ncbi:MAG: hypothetical protein Q7R96_00755 [Nanoarchaeota archaeon]|nr:hypothetical protein [Nanoarchaeota archaeon]
MKESLRRELLGLCQTSPDQIRVVAENPECVYVAGFMPKQFLGGAIEAKIDAFWNELEANENAKGNTNFFNGGQCEFAGYTDQFTNGSAKEKKPIGINLLQTDYKHAVASKKGNLGPELWLIGNSGAIIFRSLTGERNYVFGERNKSVQNVGGVLELPPAGYIDVHNPRIVPKDFQCGVSGYSIFDANILDEREEELGFPFEDPDDIWFGESKKTVDVQAVGIIKIVPYHDYNVSHVIEMNTSEEEVREMFARRPKKNELDAIHVVPESRLLAFMRERGQTLGPRAKSHFEHMIKYADVVQQEY